MPIKVIASRSSQMPAIEAKGPAASQGRRQRENQGGSLGQSGSGRSAARRHRRERTSRRGHGGRCGGQAGAGDRRHDRPVFPRSAVKAIQALPLIESGAADAYGLRRQGAGACLCVAWRRAGADGLAASMLARAGLDGSALECGCALAEPSRFHAGARTPRRDADALHNNCSGKHSGFICTCLHLGASITWLHQCGAPFAGTGARGDAERHRSGRMTSGTAPSTAARSRPTRCRSRASRSASLAWRRARGCRFARAGRRSG